MLSACGATIRDGIQSTGGDVFFLQNSSLSGSRAVTAGLNEAQEFCSAQGRQFVMQNSRVGSGSYQLEFRCVTPGSLGPVARPTYSAPVAEASEPRRRRGSRAASTDTAAETPAPRRGRGRRADDLNAAYAGGGTATTTMAAPAAPAAINYGSGYAQGGYLPAQPVTAQPMVASAQPAMVQQPQAMQTSTRAQPNLPAELPPVATTPLFNPPPGTHFAPTPAPMRLPADNRPYAPVAGQAGPAPAGTAITPAAAAPAQPLSDGLPPIQVTPVVAPSAAPAASSTSSRAAPAPQTYVVPSPNALPGANSALTPIAAPPVSERPAPRAPVQNLNVPPPGFFTGPR